MSFSLEVTNFHSRRREPSLPKWEEISVIFQKVPPKFNKTFVGPNWLTAAELRIESKFRLSLKTSKIKIILKKWNRINLAKPQTRRKLELFATAIFRRKKIKSVLVILYQATKSDTLNTTTQQINSRCDCDTEVSNSWMINFRTANNYFIVKINKQMWSSSRQDIDNLNK